MTSIPFTEHHNPKLLPVSSGKLVSAIEARLRANEYSPPLLELRQEILGDFHQAQFSIKDRPAGMIRNAAYMMYEFFHLNPKTIHDLRAIGIVAAHKLLKTGSVPTQKPKSHEYPQCGSIYRYVSSPDGAIFSNLKDFLTPPDFYRTYSPSEKAPYVIWDEYRKLPSGEALDKLYSDLSMMGGRGAFLGQKELPIFLSPEVITFTPTGARSYAKYSCFRAPFGSLAGTRDEVIARQRDIETGRLELATIEIAGRVAPEFLKWIRGSSSICLGPAPDVEFLYSLVLPSGAPYTFVLRRSRLASQKPENPHTQYTSEDWDTIRYLGNYFSNSDHRENMTLLYSFRRHDLPDVSDPDKYLDELDNLDRYIELRSKWWLGVLSQVAESAKEYTRPREVDWLDPAFENLEHFQTVVEARLDVIPQKYPFRGEDFFVLTPEERERFLNKYVNRLYAICNEERERVNSADSEAEHNKRVEKKYFGPKEGFALPLDFMIMDMIVDLKTRDSFAVKRAARDGVSPGQIVIPPHIGRSYEKPERFFGIEDLPELIRSSTTKRHVEAKFFDPRTGIIDQVEGIENIHRRLTEVETENVKRALGVMGEFMVSDDLEKSHGHISGAWHNMPWVFSFTLRTLAREMRRADLALEDVSKNKSERLGSLSQELQRSGSRNIREELKAAAAKLSEEVTKAESRRQLTRRVFVDVVKHFLDDYANNHLIRLDEISDQHLLRFAFSIGANSIPIISEEVIKREGRSRHTHSEQLGGKNMYAGGFLILSKHREVFHDAENWMKFCRYLEKSTDLKWVASAITDESGHYLPSPNTLEYAAACIYPKLDQVNISHDRCELVDALSPGLKTQSLDIYRY